MIRPVLVTGGAGFVGSSLVRRLLARGDEVRVLDDLSTGRRENVPAEAELIEADLRDADAVRNAVRGCELVFHQGALPSVPRSFADPHTSAAIIIEGTLNVLLAARDEGVRRVVLASSSSVYGNGGTLPRAESARPAPMSPYAVAKLAAEGFCSTYSREGVVETVTLRYFNVFGPGQDPDSAYAAVIPRFITAAGAGAPLTIYGDGLQSRDFTYVEDTVVANLLAAEATEVDGAVLNVSGGAPRTVLDVANAVGAQLGRGLLIEHLPTRAGDVRDSWADLSESKRLLGYEPKTSLEEGLAATIEMGVAAA